MYHSYLNFLDVAYFFFKYGFLGGGQILVDDSLQEKDSPKKYFVSKKNKIKLIISSLTSKLGGCLILFPPLAPDHVD